MQDVTIGSIMSIVSTKNDNKTIENETLQAISNFCLLWNLFEKTFFNEFYHQRDLCSKINKKGSALRISESILNKALSYFKGRYIESADADYYFEKLHLEKSCEPQDIKDVLNDFNQNVNHLLWTVLTIIGRYRNNLFHGPKLIQYLDAQRDNFIIANNVLLDLLKNNQSRQAAVN
jgi:hypothetical protein